MYPLHALPLQSKEHCMECMRFISSRCCPRQTETCDYIWLELLERRKNNRCYAIFVNIYFSIYTCFHMHGMHDIHRAAKCIDVYSGLHLLSFLKLQFEEKPHKLHFLHLWACFCFLSKVEIPKTFLQARSSLPGRCELQEHTHIFAELRCYVKSPLAI